VYLITANWCNPCSELKNWLQENDLAKHITILDIDEDFEELLALQVSVLPTLVVGNSYLQGREEIKPYLTEKYLG